MIKKIILIFIIFICLLYINNNYQHFKTKIASINYGVHSFDSKDIDGIFGKGEGRKPLQTFKRTKIIGKPGIGATKTIIDISFKPNDIKDKFGNIGLVNEGNVSYIDNAALIGKLFEIIRVLYDDNEKMMNTINEFKGQIYNLESDVIKIKQKI